MSITILTLIIRFSHTIPDLHLSLKLDPTTTTTLAIKKELRKKLPEEFRKNNLKLIHGGRVLDDGKSINEDLRLSYVQREGETPEEGGFDSEEEKSVFDSSPKNGGNGKGKGKERVYHTRKKSNKELEPIYIHCAISSDPLPASKLKLEDEASTIISPKQAGKAHGSTSTGFGSNNTQSRQPVGFDRLLSSGSGFSTSDVLSLRSQFRQITANRYTPDTMPSPTSMLRMEEQWLDSEAFTSGSTGQGGSSSLDSSTVGGIVMEDDDSSAAINDTLYGVCSGFFWPIGGIIWGLREEGVWSRRRGFAVVAGVLVNVVFGLVRILG